MWRTPIGTLDRIISPAELRVIKHGANLFIDELKMSIDGGHDYTIINCGTPFCNLQLEQKLVVVAEVLDALTNKNAAPAHTAINEACIYILFEYVVAQADFFHDGMAEDYKDEYEAFKADILAAAKEHKLTRMTSLKSLTYEKQKDLIHELSNLILWDHDFFHDDITDLEPVHAGVVKQFMRVDDSYFGQIVEEPDKSLIKKSKQKLNSILK